MAVDRAAWLSIIMFAFSIPTTTKNINSSGFCDHLAWARRSFRGVGLLAMTTPGSSCCGRWRSDIVGERGGGTCGIWPITVLKTHRVKVPTSRNTFATETPSYILTDVLVA